MHWDLNHQRSGELLSGAWLSAMRYELSYYTKLVALPAKAYMKRKSIINLYFILKQREIAPIKIFF